jgi:dCTP deaminase
MLIIGDNLEALIAQYNLVDSANCFDNNCISLSLDQTIIEIQPPVDEIVTYGDEIPSEWVKENRIATTAGYILEPGAAILACSKEVVEMPNGYFGFLQTKGSLARLFVTIHCCDAQIDPGFKGKITFEICNLSKMRIKLIAGSKVGSLYIMKSSTRTSKLYNGKYNNSDKPTIQLPQS